MVVSCHDCVMVVSCHDDVMVVSCHDDVMVVSCRDDAVGPIVSRVAAARCVVQGGAAPLRQYVQRLGALRARPPEEEQGAGKSGCREGNQRR